jgi:anti-anti-sigma factor
MGVEFKLTRRIPQDRSDVAVLHLSGWLDAQAEEQLVAAVKLAKDNGASYVLLDLGGVTTITSAGIRGIQKSFGVLTPKGGATLGRLKLCNASPQVREVLSITGLLVSVPMYESEDIGIDSFGK